MLDQNEPLAGDPIRAPGNPEHVMWVRTFARRITVTRKGQTLAQTIHPKRVIELGRDLLDPIIYIPVDDVLAELRKNLEQTFCPLKGHAGYFNLMGPGGAPVVQDIAWGYDVALETATILRGHLAFDPSLVEITEAPI